MQCGDQGYLFSTPDYRNKSNVNFSQILNYHSISEAYSEPRQIYKMEVFVRIVNCV